MDLTLSTITAMRHQEDTGYVTAAPADFLLHQHDQRRALIAIWCCNTLDYVHLRRETASIAMSYFDRFLMTKEGSKASKDQQMYQLTAMTCLYTAVKIHEEQAMDPELVSQLSRGAYSPQQVESTEALILNALGWRLNPPTALSFVRQFLDLIPEDALSQEVRQTVYDVTKYQTELAVSQSDFVPIKSSTVAYCALLNALESVGVNGSDRSSIGSVLSRAIGIDNCRENDEVVFDVQNLLYESVMRQADRGIAMVHPTAPAVKHVKVSRRSSVEESPRSVSAMP